MCIDITVTRGIADPRRRMLLHGLCRPRGERGAASMLQMAIITPVLLIGVFMTIQIGLLLNARDVAQEAAQEGASAARSFDGSDNAGVHQAQQFLRQTGTSSLLVANVTANRNAQTATVTVTGTVRTFIPGLHLHVSEQATGPVERYVPPSREFTNAEGSNDGP